MHDRFTAFPNEPVEGHEQQSQAALQRRSLHHKRPRSKRSWDWHWRIRMFWFCNRTASRDRDGASAHRFHSSSTMRVYASSWRRSSLAMAMQMSASTGSPSSRAWLRRRAVAHRRRPLLLAGRGSAYQSGFPGIAALACTGSCSVHVEQDEAGCLQLRTRYGSHMHAS